MDEKLHQHNQNISGQKADTNKSNDLVRSLQDSPEYKKDMYRLGMVYMELFGTDFLGDYSCYTQEAKQCSDGSDLYTIIKYEGKDTIVKVGAGEFNTKVFTNGNQAELKGFYTSPVPLFVVNQGHSYLGDNADKELRLHKAKEYLDKYAVIISPKGGEAYYRPHGERGQKIDYNHIHVKQYDDALVQGRLALLQKEFSPVKFPLIVYRIKKLKEMDFEQFYKQIWKGAKFVSDDMNQLIGCLRHMGINTVGCGVGDRDAYQSLYDLIQTFDTHKAVFIKPDIEQ